MVARRCVPEWWFQCRALTLLDCLPRAQGTRSIPCYCCGRANKQSSLSSKVKCRCDIGNCMTFPRLSPDQSISRIIQKRNRIHPRAYPRGNSSRLITFQSKVQSVDRVKPLGLYFCYRQIYRLMKHKETPKRCHETQITQPGPKTKRRAVKQG